jgi:hypothetical protein
MKDDLFNKDKQDEKFHARREDEAAQDKQRRINYGLTFSTREGFDVIKDIMAFCHVMEISFYPENQHETAFREGERNVFLYILSQLSDEMKQKLIIGG